MAALLALVVTQVARHQRRLGALPESPAVIYWTSQRAQLLEGSLTLDRYPERSTIGREL